MVKGTMKGTGRGERTYGQWCPIAVGLDLLGDRWVLLICRELAIGDRRFTDLRAALPGLAPNLLTDRLRALESAGLVTTVELPPPAARTVYHLTDDGLAVTPVLRAVARFGARYLTGAPGPGFSARRAAHALLLPWRQPVEVDGRLRLELDDGDAVDVVVRRRETTVERPDGDPDVTVATSAAALAEARRDATAPLAATVTGSREYTAALLDAFDLRVARLPRGRAR